VAQPASVRALAAAQHVARTSAVLTLAQGTHHGGSIPWDLHIHDPQVRAAQIYAEELAVLVPAHCESVRHCTT